MPRVARVPREARAVKVLSIPRDSEVGSFRTIRARSAAGPF